MNLPPYGFDVDHVAKIRSGLSITVREKKKLHKINAKNDLILVDFVGICPYRENYRLKKK